MAQVPVQVLPGGVLNATSHAVQMAGRTALAQTAVGASAVDVDLDAMDVTAQDQCAMFVVHTDATAGELTVVLVHDSDGVGTLVAVEDGLVKGGDVDVNDNQGVTSMTLDMADTANQGTILVGIAPTAAERTSPNGTLVQQLQTPFNLRVSTDGAWHGPAIDVVGLTGCKRHQPGAKPGA